MKEFLHILSLRETLSQEQAEAAMHLMMQGEAEPEHAAGLLMGLRTRGETLDELIGFTRVMREYAVHVECDDPHAIDLCGTGGDSSGTLNISTHTAAEASRARRSGARAAIRSDRRSRRVSSRR